MGFNTTVVVLNDGLRSIEEDPRFGRTLADAIRQTSVGSLERVDVGAGGFCNAATVIETHHADSIHAIAVGGNIGRDMGRIGNWRSYDDDEVLLRALANRYGYELVAK